MGQHAESGKGTEIPPGAQLNEKHRRKYRNSDYPPGPSPADDKTGAPFVKEPSEELPLVLSLSCPS